MKDMRIIKRYSNNRKLYDVSQSRYVNLAELEQMVRAGIEIIVIDSSSNKDITYKTLLKLLFEQVSSCSNSNDMDFLKRIILSKERTLTGCIQSLESSNQ